MGNDIAQLLSQIHASSQSLANTILPYCLAFGLIMLYVRYLFSQKPQEYLSFFIQVAVIAGLLLGYRYIFETLGVVIAQLAKVICPNERFTFKHIYVMFSGASLTATATPWWQQILPASFRGLLAPFTASLWKIALGVLLAMQMLLQALLYMVGPMVLALSVIPSVRKIAGQWAQEFLIVCAWSISLAVLMRVAEPLLHLIDTAAAGNNLVFTMMVLQVALTLMIIFIPKITRLFVGGAISSISEGIGMATAGVAFAGAQLGGSAASRSAQSPQVQKAVAGGAMRGAGKAALAAGGPATIVPAMVAAGAAKGAAAIKKLAAASMPSGASGAHAGGSRPPILGGQT